MPFRIGSGFDVHSLIIDENRPLIIGGVTIAGPLALKGHSDADVVLHAIADALLGAIAFGDIGMAFPDTDSQFKNMDSKIIVQFALEKVIEKGFQISNIDVTIIGERPKISPHRGAIQQSIASLLKLASDQVGIKATTTEKMGFLGRAEGLACQAVVLIQQK